MIARFGLSRQDAIRLLGAYLRRDVGGLWAERGQFKWGEGEWFESNRTSAATALLDLVLWEQGQAEPAVESIVLSVALHQPCLEDTVWLNPARLRRWRTPPVSDPCVDCSTLIAAPGAPQYLPAFERVGEVMSFT